MHPKIVELVKQDPRYMYEAYEFVFEGLRHAQKMFGKEPAEDTGEPPAAEHHVTGRELLEGIRELALREFGLMARTVFQMWGVNSTDDFGEIVFRLVEAKQMSKTDEDTLDDFHEVYNLDDALVKRFEIRLEEAD